MKILDRITLLKAGYTRKEIDEMIQAEKEEPEKKDPEPEEKKDPEPEEKKDPEPEPDYKTEYEKEKAAREALQEANRRRDNSGKDHKSDEDILKDIVSSFI